MTGDTRDAIVFNNRPATLASTDAAAGVVPTAWYVEVYNQSRAGEGRAGTPVTARAYAICAAP